MNALKNKKILYIGVSTFNYEKEIKSALGKMGALVDYYDERPANDFLTKVFLRLNFNLLIQRKIKSHYSNIQKKIKNVKYDYVFIIKLETIDDIILKNLKNSQEHAVFILYLWDSLRNYKGKEKLLKYFDKAFSFDSSDSNEFDKLSFLPLFYIPTYEKISTQNKHIKYDLCFIGTGHTDRYLLVKAIEEKANKLNLKIYSFLYLQNRLLFVFRKLFDKRVRSSKIKDFSFTALSQQQVVEIISQSNTIIDIEHQGQKGLTMRTIEMIGCKKKLITTNQSVKGYDFYNKNNINVIDRNNPSLEKEFLNTPYQELDDKIYEKYSLINWLRTIFL